MNQGQQAPPAQVPPAQPAAVAPPPVLPAPLPPPAGPAPPAPAFALGPGRSHAVLNFDDPNTGATATKLYNKAISPLDTKFDGEADNLAVFLMSVRDRARRFNWQRLITVPIDDGTTRNLLTHFGQVSLDKHEGTCSDLRQHSHKGCARQRHVLLFFGGLSDERLPHHHPTLRRRVHGDQRSCRFRTAQADHHPHSGGQPGFHHAYPRDVD